MALLVRFYWHDLSDATGILQRFCWHHFTVVCNFDADFNDLEDLSSETYSIVGEVSEETLRIFKEFAETNRVFQRLNNGVFSNANIDLDYPKKDYIAKIKAIGTNDIEEIKKNYKIFFSYLN